MVAVGLAVAATAPRAVASCMPQPSLETAIEQTPIVIVGTVSSTRSRDRIATVNVDEVWKGTIEPTFELWAGPEQDNEATSVDRTYA
ncbi:MAG: hypothetical protein ACRD0U_06015, partial [Acidimicrobiales bacterium]